MKVSANVKTNESNKGKRDKLRALVKARTRQQPQASKTSAALKTAAAAAAAAAAKSRRKPLTRVQHQQCQLAAVPPSRHPTDDSAAAAKIKEKPTEKAVRSERMSEDSELLDSDESVAEVSAAVAAACSLLDFSRNPQLVSAYAGEIFAYLHRLQHRQPVPLDFLRAQDAASQQYVTPRMRGLLFDWLVRVHQRFALQPETLYLTFHIVDYYCGCRDCPDGSQGGAPARSEYQLLGLAAMFLAAKYEEVCPPEIADFVYLAEEAYTEQQIRWTERAILRRLDYFLGHPAPLVFLRRYGHACGATQSEHELAKYLAELAASAYRLAHLPPSAVAAAALTLARRLLLLPPGRLGGGHTRLLLATSGYSQRQLQPVVACIARLAAMAASPASGFGAAVRSKYSRRQHSCVSTWPQVSSDCRTLLELAECQP